MLIRNRIRLEYPNDAMQISVDLGLDLASNSRTVSEFMRFTLVTIRNDQSSLVSSSFINFPPRFHSQSDPNIFRHLTDEPDNARKKWWLNYQANY